MTGSNRRWTGHCRLKMAQLHPIALSPDERPARCPPAGRRVRRLAVAGGVAWLCCLFAAAPALATPVFSQVAGSPFNTGSGPESVAFSPSGGLLATGNRGAGTVSVFSVGAGSALTQVPGSPFSTGSEPDSVAFSPGGGLLATANSYAGTVSVFSVGAGGVLTPVSGSPFNTGSGRSRLRSARREACSRPGTGAPARCQCSQSAPAAR